MLGTNYIYSISFIRFRRSKLDEFLIHLFGFLIDRKYLFGVLVADYDNRDAVFESIDY
jgi:hypothetical protein